MPSDLIAEFERRIATWSDPDTVEDHDNLISIDYYINILTAALTLAKAMNPQVPGCTCGHCAALAIAAKQIGGSK